MSRSSGMVDLGMGGASVLSSIRPSTTYGGGHQSGWGAANTSQQQRMSAAGSDDSFVYRQRHTSLAQNFSRALGSLDAQPQDVAFKFGSNRELSADEKHLWSLAEMLCEDSSRTYDAAAFNLASVPATRRWCISQQTLLQDLLHRSPVIRRLTVVLRWLERTAATDLSVQQPGKAAETPDEHQLLLENVFKLIRIGDHQLATHFAAMADKPVLTSTLMGISLKKVHESWEGRAEVVGLFGEYEADPPESGPWASNDHRMSLLSTLYDTAKENVDGKMDAINSLDTAICGALSGFIPAMSRHGFDAKPNWKDKLWCELRGKLTHIYAKTHLPYTNSAASPAFIEAIDVSCGAAGGNWIAECEKYVQQEIHSLLTKWLHRSNAAVAPLSLLDAVQVKLIMLFLSDGAHGEIFPHSLSSSDYVRVSANLLALMDLEEQRSFLPTGPQRNPTQFVAVLVAYVQNTLLGAETLLDDPSSICDFALPLLGSIRDTSLRAKAYTALLQITRARHPISERSMDEVQRIEDEEALMLRHVKVWEMDRWGGAGIVEEVLRLISNATLVQAEELIADYVAGSPRGTATIGFGDANEIHDDHRGLSEVPSIRNGRSMSRPGADVTNQTILTHHADSEALSWLSRTDDASKLPAVFQQALETMLRLWTEHEHNAVGDVVMILGRRVMPRLAPLTEVVEQRFAFWDAAISAHRLQGEYEKVVAEIRHDREAAIMRAGSRLTKTSDLEKREEALRMKLYEQVDQCFATSYNMQEPVAEVMASTLQSYAEVCVLAIAVLPTSPTFSEQTLLPAFRFLTALEQTGRMAAELPTGPAQCLLLALRTLRAAYKQRLHDDFVEQTLSTAISATQ